MCLLYCYFSTNNRFPSEAVLLYEEEPKVSQMKHNKSITHVNHFTTGMLPEKIAKSLNSA